MRNIITTFAFLLTINSFSQVYVNISNTSGTYDGNSWATAYNNIQDGIDHAFSAGGAEVWVAQGTYYIYESSTENTLRLKKDVFVYGGFSGTESTLEERDWNMFETIIDGHEFSGSTNRVKHVVTALLDDGDTFWNNGLIDGFIIQGGYAVNAEPPGKNSKATDPVSIMASNGEGAGAGILIFQCSVNVSNCIIQNNEASKAGGVYVMVADEFPTMSPNAAPNFTNCIIQNNHATMRGGGMQCDLASHPSLESCKFLNNSCDAKGGGLYNDFGCSPTLTNCLFAFNTALRAGGMGNDGSSSPILINCTISKNYTTDVGAGIYTGSYNPDGPSNEPTLVNCIVYGNETLWGGPADLRVWHTNYFYINNSDLGNGFTSFGTGNILSDPMFVDADGGDFKLQASSPCRDAGTQIDAPEYDIDGFARDANPDMGAYEYQLTEIQNNTDFSNSINIFPNPASIIVTIQSDKLLGNIEFFDITGKTVFSKIINDKTTEIPVHDLCSGIYFVKTNNVVSKLVISHQPR
ncbi:MAG: T9SS type A sorting domain-containing protein [Bacteroidales bacterium]|nr:T9SS type A sorting domain-containing protein [Bacteroidales bacterium]